MKTRTFCVLSDSIVEFAEIIEENELEGVIVGTNGEDEIEINVDYEPEEHSQAILDMIEHIESLKESQEDGDD